MGTESSSKAKEQEKSQPDQMETVADPPAAAATTAAADTTPTATAATAASTATADTSKAKTPASTAAKDDSGVSKKCVDEPASGSKKAAQPGVTFKVNNVSPSAGLSFKHLSIDDVLAKAKLIDAGGHSKHPGGFLAQRLRNSFVGAVALAFDSHLPLSLRPEHFWALIVQGIALHMNHKDNAEALRGKFVKHDGKKTLIVIRDSFVLNKTNDWHGVVTEFDDQISKNVVPGVAKEMEMNFSTTTATEKACGTVAVMSAMQQFFEYRVRTRCGFPSITLEGSLADWQLLRHKAEALIRTRCLPELSKRWLPAMLPVLERFARQYQKPKDVDVDFWQSMCKTGGMGGSGGYTWLNGWFNVFMPYLKDSVPNEFCVPYSEDMGYVKEGLTNNNMYSQWDGPPPKGAKGPAVPDMPNGLATAPAIWEYCGTDIPMEFISGFIGVEQRKGGAVAPALGWYLQHKTEPKKSDRYM